EDGNFAIFGSTYDEGDLEVLYTELNVYSYDESMSGVVDDPDYIEGEVIYHEDFTNSDTGWDEWDASDSTGRYNKGEFIVDITESRTMRWSNAYESFADVSIGMDVRKVAGSDDNAMGIVLRYQDVDNFYVFSISSDGYYVFGYYLDDEWVPLVDWTPSDSINQGEEANYIEVTCKGPRFILKINGDIVASLNDDTFDMGDIGLMAASNQDDNVTISFSDVIVWEVE
ncbi:MAG: hypothetical protein GXY52_00500, partial [Chloroflexi bacterium]|nr:hypothetical protein [Chloroflexota bacterium]